MTPRLFGADHSHEATSEIDLHAAAEPSEVSSRFSEPGVWGDATSPPVRQVLPLGRRLQANPSKQALRHQQRAPVCRYIGFGVLVRVISFRLALTSNTVPT